MAAISIAPTVHAVGGAVAGPTPASGSAVRMDAPRGAERKPALLGDEFCTFRAVSPCSSTASLAIVWTTDNARGFCGFHVEQYHALQASRRAA